jgi:hypothetical protein
VHLLKKKNEAEKEWIRSNDDARRSDRVSHSNNKTPEALNALFSSPSSDED